ncbi:MAG: DUF1294 domain-containing protein [Clostridia bacterium]|nr:DUF1294 domain-containing protein [Clostridia bacterium]
MKYILIYLGFVNLIGIFLCIKDKRAAKKGKWRVKENTLITLCLFGGSLGIYLCMKLIRHKTKHKKFMVGIPLIMVLQVIFVIVATLHIKS